MRQDVEAVHLRHHEVDDDEVGVPLPVEPQELLRVVGEACLPAGPLDLDFQETPDVGIVIDDQDALRG